MKLCPSCDQVKDEAEFHRNKSARDGLQRHCKPCHLADNRQWVRNSPEIRRAALKKQNAPRAARRSPPEKARAHNAVWKSVKAGKIIRPKICSQCGGDRSPIHAHHDDYTKPLEVSWLCAPCHGMLHAKQRGSA